MTSWREQGEEGLQEDSLPPPGGNDYSLEGSLYLWKLVINCDRLDILLLEKYECCWLLVLH